MVRLLCALLACCLLLLQTSMSCAQLAGPRAIAVTDPRYVAYQQQEMDVTFRLEELRSRPRRWLPAAVVAGVGVASLAIGAVLMHAAWKDRCDGADCGGGYNQSMDRAALVLMPVGSLLTLVATPWMAVRLSRSLRMGRVQRELDALRAAGP